MPLVKRQIEPVHVCRKKLDARAGPNELEAVVVNCMAGFIRQLSDLARQTNDLFNELLWESDAVARRTNNLALRLTDLRDRLDEVDCDDEDCDVPTDFEAIINTNHFKSRQKPIQQLFTADSRPFIIQEVYEESDPPPSLRKFNEFHPPKTDCMDSYSCPRYFFELWASGELQKQMARKHNRRGRSTLRSKGIPNFSRTWTKTDVQRIKVRKYAHHGPEFGYEGELNTIDETRKHNHLTITSADSGFHTGSESDLRSIGMSSTARDDALKFHTMSLTSVSSSDLFGRNKRSGTLSRIFGRKKSHKSPAAKERAALRDLFDLDQQNADSHITIHQNTPPPARRTSTTSCEPSNMYEEVGMMRRRAVSDAGALHPARPAVPHQQVRTQSAVHRHQSTPHTTPEIMSFSQSPSVKRNGAPRMTVSPPQPALHRVTSPIYEVPPVEDRPTAAVGKKVNGIEHGQFDMSLSSQVEQLLRSRSNSGVQNQLSVPNGMEHRSDVSGSSSGIESDIQSSASSTSSGSLQKQLSNHPLLRKTLSQIDSSQQGSANSSPLIPRSFSMTDTKTQPEPFYDAVGVQQRDAVAKYNTRSGYSEPQSVGASVQYAVVNKAKPRIATEDRGRQEVETPHADRRKSRETSAGEVIAVHVEDNNVYYVRSSKKTTMSHSDSSEIDDSHTARSPVASFTSHPLPLATPVQSQVTIKSFGSGATRKSLSDDKRDSLHTTPVSARMHLLSAIQKGKQLRKVDREQHQKEVAARRSIGPMGFSVFDVASILARRVAIEDDDEAQSASGSTGDNLDSDDDWD